MGLKGGRGEELREEGGGGGMTNLCLTVSFNIHREHVVAQLQKGGEGEKGGIGWGREGDYRRGTVQDGWRGEWVSLP